MQVKASFWTDFFESKGEVKPIKEPDNEYTKEAIRVELRTLYLSNI